MGAVLLLPWVGLVCAHACVRACVRACASAWEFAALFKFVNKPN